MKFKLFNKVIKYQITKTISTKLGFYFRQNLLDFKKIFSLF